jgi:exopolysaccharide biosynthesis polyprenyl glycosylphosphotransferase
MSVTSDAAVSELHPEAPAHQASRTTRNWIGSYLRRAALADCACALGGGVLAAEARFAGQGYLPRVYVGFTCLLPVLWWAAVMLAGGYDGRFIGVGSEEFRRVLNAAVSLTATVAIMSYLVRYDLARGYVAMALPSAAAADLVARYRLRKRLHRLRGRGACTRRVVAVGHAAAVADLVTSLRRDRHHGLAVVAACVAGVPETVLVRPDGAAEVAGVPVAGGLGGVAAAVNSFGADTVAVLACPEMNGTRLRELAWELEKTSTDLCVAPALMDVAGPRTTIRPVAGLPLLHVDHPELAGVRQVVKGAFDRLAAAGALILLAPVFAAIAVTLKLTDPGPVFFRQARVGKDGGLFTLFKFRTMVVDAERWRPLLAGSNEADGALFKIRRDPRVTSTGGWLRRWSLDELPQLLNVLTGDMSLVGPRPALPEEAEAYGHHVRRRLAVKPGITGLWQVSGRSDLPWDETVRLDLRYVENWSFALDLQILWKTGSAVIRGSGAY